MGADKQLSRWAEHFEELLNRPAPANTSDIPTAEEDLPIDCGKSTREEIREAIKQLKIKARQQAQMRFQRNHSR